MPFKLKEINISTYHNWALKPQLAGGRPVGYLQQDRVIKLGPTSLSVRAALGLATSASQVRRFTDHLTISYHHHLNKLL